MAEKNIPLCLVFGAGPLDFADFEKTENKEGFCFITLNEASLSKNLKNPQFLLDGILPEHLNEILELKKKNTFFKPGIFDSIEFDSEVSKFVWPFITKEAIDAWHSLLKPHGYVIMQSYGDSGTFIYDDNLRMEWEKILSEALKNEYKLNDIKNVFLSFNWQVGHRDFTTPIWLEDKLMKGVFKDSYSKENSGYYKNSKLTI